MRIGFTIKVATGIALVFPIAWLVYQPGFEPVITVITLSIALAGLFVDRPLSEDDAKSRKDY